MKIFQKSDGSISFKRIIVALLIVLAAFRFYQMQQEGAAKAAADAEARKLGWANANQMESARLAGCNDMECYKQHKAEADRKWEEEKERLRAEKALEAKQKQDADSQSSSSNAVAVDDRSKRDAQGYTRADYERICSKYKAAESECAVADNVNKCVEVKMSDNRREWATATIACSGVGDWRNKKFDK